MDQLQVRLREGALIALVALCLYLCLALFSFDPSDPGWSYTGVDSEVSNLMGRLGAWIADVLFFLFGYLACIFPMMLGYQAWLVFRERGREFDFNWPMFALRALGLVLTLAAGAGIASLHFYRAGANLRQGSGGVLGSELAGWLEPASGYMGATLVLLACFLFGLTAFIDISWIKVMDRVGRWTLTLADRGQVAWVRWRNRSQEQARAREVTDQRHEALAREVEKKLHREPVKILALAPKPPEVSARVAREKQGNLFKVDAVDGLPALHLLDASVPDASRGRSADDLEAMSRLLELKLLDYGVEALVEAVFPGPVITRFEIKPSPGVKVSKISGLVKDLARSLAVISVRVVEVIPGKSVIGIEIPNVDREIVKLSQVLSSNAYDNAQSPLSLALGHDIAGEPVVVDLARMPHLLVAGTTGSGKSVGINAMIISILFKASPEDVRLIMVDPKMLELAVYEGIPHLLTPVVTDMKDAANALRWCVAEMERRYRLMAALGVRNVGGFNRKVKDAEKAGTPLTDPLWQPTPLQGLEETAPNLSTLPFIVVIIDEFADMMMVVGKKVEELIARIAQKARAAGIHLILATQRPSVDVITGLIKANVPTRIAFQVSSKIDSRTILDQGGAEQLLGHGDMLYLPAGSALPVRVHGAFVDDDEVHRVVDSWKQLGAPNYLDEILDPRSDNDLMPGVAGGQDDDEDGEQDLLYDEAVEFVATSRRASISAVQRKLRVGYNRAARMIETMEQAGIVSEMNTNGSREVLINAPSE
ncbi:MAG: DNA translocase FtsK 4TM domain-containing protein [Pseudomonadales bacterium]|nr:DNA translocase FtsK 4TM domain-containing protein [Pseudomonadales bacterium]MDP4640437.1 DNA translocase FtsK 4TM domain-containing protein [Pseudomonadales bacterium]MDP4766034.1 DNA translocase FtsK 4TM domain-containing protein [Pseudomonadales bacterium]MDP4875232.1 DNA translocase FtsK 4TM domain-containing protein [Pseudomonadales bacterium]MDP4910939.1 DNA translocase FtsK 4TM domain-containing protein [Pseudomonadales bacterium]